MVPLPVLVIVLVLGAAVVYVLTRLRRLATRVTKLHKTTAELAATSDVFDIVKQQSLSREDVLRIIHGTQKRGSALPRKHAAVPAPVAEAVGKPGPPATPAAVDPGGKGSSGS